MKQVNTGKSKFNVTIRMGNEAMQSPEDVTAIMVHIARQLDAGQLSGPLYDVNGNKVGSYGFTD